MQKINRFIITFQPGAADTAVGELQKTDGSVRTAEIFSPEVRMIETSGGESALVAEQSQTEAALNSRIIFTRHMFPVYYSGDISSPEWMSVLPQSGSELGGCSFSVQLRVVRRDEKIFSRAKTILEEAEAALTARGFEKDDRRPEWALSLLINKDTLYAGASRCAHNLSHWNGGEARFKKDENFISRAEFKLLEAFEVFGMSADGDGLANRRGLTGANGKASLDLGASPGGWTKALLDRGFTVTAVDPAEMHPSLIGRPGLTHIPKVIQRCGFADGSFDLIVNDMRMDAYDSARIMLDCAPMLRSGASAVMTLKLTPGHWLKKTANVLKLLEERYRITGARQLFHNRDEVTAVMTPVQS